MELFKAGKSISEIAKERELAETTIFGHLAKFVTTGEVEVTALISETHYEELRQLIPKQTYENLTDLKTKLDQKYSYNDIKLVLETLNTK